MVSGTASMISRSQRSDFLIICFKSCVRERINVGSSERKSEKVGCACIYAHVFVLLCHCPTQT